MKPKLTLVLFIVGFLILVTGLMIVIRVKSQPDLPSNSNTRLDQLDIQTQDPQPAGKNIPGNGPVIKTD